MEKIDDQMKLFTQKKLLKGIVQIIAVKKT